jgi:integrase
VAKKRNQLSVKHVEALMKPEAKPGWYSDGGSLFLRVGGGNRRRWFFIYRERGTGKRREMGLGSASDVTLAEVRDRADAARRAVKAGGSPIEARNAEELARQSAQTFCGFVADWLPEISREFRNEKHRRQWEMTLTTYTATINDKAIAEIGTNDILDVLQPHWRRRPETASRLRGRIERVLDAAKAKGLRAGENPARWKGHLDHLLSARQKLTRGHHAAMPYREVPDFLARLSGLEGMSARALEFLILTAARTGEVLGMRWAEIDLERKVWTVPPQRMKAGREHRVPLTERVLDLLGRIERQADGYVFPGARRGKPLSIMALTMVLRRMKAGSVTVHGFRAAFKTWAMEETRFPRELTEAALAHVVGDVTERAYARGDALERRRELMAAWERHCSLSPKEAVVSLAAYRSKG